MPQGTTFDQVKEKIVDSMYVLDDIWKYPSDEALAKTQKAAADIYSYYMKDAYSHPGATVQVPGVPSAPPVQQTQVQGVVEHAGQVVRQTVADVAPVTQQQAVQSVQAPQPQTQVPQQPPQTEVVTVAPTQVAQQAVAVAASAVQSAPTDRPACFGGATPRKDGGVGYSDESEECLMCPHELTCMDACKVAS